MASVIIVGGGIVGLSSAYYLQKTGWDVTVLDQGDFTDNCSYGNAGMLVPSHFTPMAAPGMISQGIRWMFDSKSPFYVKPSLSWNLISWGLNFMKNATDVHVDRSAPYLRDLNLYSSEQYGELAKDLDAEIGLERKGILMLYKTAHTEEEELTLAAKARGLGLDVVDLTKEQVQALEPDVKLDVRGAVHYKCDSHLYPGALMAALISSLKKSGVKLVSGAGGTKIVTDAGIAKSVITPKGEFSADKIVLAAGAWLGDVAKLAGLKVPILPGKGYSFMVDDFGGKVKHPALLLEARVALTPMGGRVRLGGTMELAAINHKTNMNRVEGIVNSVPKYYPEYPVALPEEKTIWHGFRPCSADGLPYLGVSKKLKNVVVAGGLGMMGLSLGPGVGKTVADILNDIKPKNDLTLYKPERFG